MKTVFSILRASFFLLLIMTVISGAYSLFVFGLGQVFFPKSANGSLIVENNTLIGSALIGQDFTQPRYFWPRLSATTPPYNAMASGGSNLSPTSGRLVENANARIAALQKNKHGDTRIPLDLLTSSASGLDPDISPEAAHFQAPRIAQARKRDLALIERLIVAHTKKPWLGFIGQPRVNVLELNLALDNL